MKKYSAAEIQHELTSRPGWSFKHDKLEKVYTFPAYLDGIRFVDRLAEEAEKLNHHPDIFITWCRVTVRLSTHDADGITRLDFQLADKADELR